jgi:hypothetical protein
MRGRAELTVTLAHCDVKVRMRRFSGWDTAHLTWDEVHGMLLYKGRGMRPLGTMVPCSTSWCVAHQQGARPFRPWLPCCSNFVWHPCYCQVTVKLQMCIVVGKVNRNFTRSVQLLMRTEQRCDVPHAAIQQNQQNSTLHRQQPTRCNVEQHYIC